MQKIKIFRSKKKAGRPRTGSRKRTGRQGTEAQARSITQLQKEHEQEQLKTRARAERPRIGARDAGSSKTRAIQSLRKPWKIVGVQPNAGASFLGNPEARNREILRTSLSETVFHGF